MTFTPADWFLLEPSKQHAPAFINPRAKLQAEQATVTVAPYDAHTYLGAPKGDGMAAAALSVNQQIRLFIREAETCPYWLSKLRVSRCIEMRVVLRVPLCSHS